MAVLDLVVGLIVVAVVGYIVYKMMNILNEAPSIKSDDENVSSSSVETPAQSSVEDDVAEVEVVEAVVKPKAKKIRKPRTKKK